ncbi:LacI family transcriptional regulator [Streptomyces sp. NBC_00433]
MNIRELARRSGVSTATVSRALNDRAEVSEATRAKIRRLASELGYAPNEPARTLVRRRSDTVGLVWDSGQEALGQHNPFLLGLLSAVRTALSDADYHLMLLTTPGAEDQDGTHLQAVQRHNLEGVIVLTTPPDDRCLRVLADSTVPCAGIDTAFTGPRTVRVSSDNAAGAEAAVQHLYELGHRRIATVTGPLHLPPAAERLAGYLRACSRLGLSVPPEYVTEGDFFLASGEAAGKRLLAAPDRPTAIFAAGDQMAIGAMHAAADAGLTVPGDLAVVGFDDIDAAALVRPALSTVAQDQRGLGVAAVEALRGLIDATAVDTEQAQPRIIPTRLLIRGSSRSGV